MATYTPNLNLYKPDPTDNYEDFLSEFNDNMNKLDGGSNKILKNQTLTFVNLVATITDSSFTATSDYAVLYYNPSYAEQAKITTESSSGTLTFTATTTPENTIICDIVIFNASSSGGGVHIYSTTEQEVGVWIDDRTIYERTFDLGSDLSCSSGTDTDTGLAKGLILHLVNAQLQSADGTWVVANVGILNNDHIGIKNFSGASIGVRYITLQYTKDDAPPIHYIEYIESSGTQYINTGITPSIDSSFEITLGSVDPLGGERAIFSTGTYSTGTYLMTQDTNNALTWYYPGKATVLSDYTNKHKVELYRGRITVDDEIIADNTNTSATTFGNITIFNVENDRFSAYKLYGFNIYDNGDLVFEGLPAKDPDGIPCLYDTVSGEYFYNAGTGSFVAGDDI